MYCICIKLYYWYIDPALQEKGVPKGGGGRKGKEGGGSRERKKVR